MRWRQALDRLAGERAARPVAQVIASVAVSAKRKKPVWVSYADGIWTHHYRSGSLDSLDVGIRPVAGLHAFVHDVFLPYCELRPGDVVIDVGAGVGEEALVFSDLVGSAGTVISIEAHPRTYACLTRNLNRLGCTNVQAHEVAVGDHEGTVLISDRSGSSAENYVGADDGIKVPMTTLDNLTAEAGITSVRLLKMNIEGAERFALRGMERLLPQIEHLAISCHDFLADVEGRDELRTKQEVSDLLQAAGFIVRTRASSIPWLGDYVYARRP
jgi:FkbM family methyltransferase